MLDRMNVLIWIAIAVCLAILLVGALTSRDRPGPRQGDWPSHRDGLNPHAAAERWQGLAEAEPRSDAQLFGAVVPDVDPLAFVRMERGA